MAPDNVVHMFEGAQPPPPPPDDLTLDDLLHEHLIGTLLFLLTRLEDADNDRDRHLLIAQIKAAVAAWPD